MLKTRPFYRKVEFWQYGIPLFLLLLWLIAFRKEIGFAVGWILGGFQFSENPEIFPVEHTTLFVALLAVISLVAYFLLAVFVTSQFVLPVHTWVDRKRVFRRLMLYFFGGHGLAAFIQEGQQVATQEEVRSSRPGVIFVDLASAVVLERQTFALRTQDRRKSPMSSSMPLLHRRPRRLNVATYEPHARAAGPGIVFTRSGERLRGVVSLRRQFRVKANTKAFTRDGFEVFGHVLCIFTLGEPPEVIRVTYVGEPKPENLQAILLDEKCDDGEVGGRTRGLKIKYVKGLNPDELDDVDKQEIQRYITNAPQFPEPPQRTARSVVTPYTFDEKRIFDAVFGGARLLKENRAEDLTDLPPKVAVEIFHNMVSTMAYDDLYRPDDPTVFPLLSEFRPRFSRTVRNLGVLSYQYIRRRDGQPITKDMLWNEEELEIFPVVPLMNSKILRDRGIKVIAASFPEIRPSNPLVLQQRFETWQARWQGESSIIRAPYDQAVVLSHSEARARAQQEIILALYPRLKSPAASETIAFSLMQSMENYMSDRGTLSKVSHRTVDLMWSLRNWLPPQGPAGEGKIDWQSPWFPGSGRDLDEDFPQLPESDGGGEE